MNQQQQAQIDFYNVFSAQTARANGRMGEYALKMQAMGGNSGQRIMQ